MTSGKKPLDPIVKVGLGIFVGAFLLIGIGMFLSRPDRSIPPYSVGSQEGTVVAIHLPPWTTDHEIAALIQRFQKVRRETHNFASMKIRPTTPQDSRGLYQRMTVYIFSSPEWAEPETLHRYLTASKGDQVDQAFKREFEQAARGGYRFDEQIEEGWLGPISPPGHLPSQQVRLLFRETVSADSSAMQRKDEPGGQG
ncbi:MAG: hypothetical protein D6704_05565 [Nitrospirae bacterium]|nr:MAG: hypothetical protein D6704_05565 [Nitrospirota bacterium]